METQRIHSIDIFRGLTIFLMVFVNDLASVSGIPTWMKHVAPDEDGMTFVDVVFPAFLFIVGMAIPFAVGNREQRSNSLFQFWKHVFTRTLGLLVLGVFMVNSGEMNTEETLIPKRLWSAALYIAAMLIWNRYPKTENKRKKNVFTALRLVGILILVFLFFVYRKGSGDQLRGMTPSWWGILGLIGWAYILSVVLFKLSNRLYATSLGILIGILGFLLVLWSDFPDPPSFFQWLQTQSLHVSHTFIVWSGILCSLIVAANGLKEKPYQKMGFMGLLGIVLLVGGYLCYPFGGISKIAATPSWTLYSSAICCFLFLLIYWLVDIKDVKNWANFLKPAGKNPLLTYILPPLFFALFGYSIFPELFTHGTWGFIKAVGFSLFILWVASWLTKKGIQLHL